MNNVYYQDELRYLRDVGPEFARANPDIARLLADRGSDPDVERMLEGVAFLCGRIRQKLDDELPEFTANLMSLLWPHYLRPIPSMSILEMLPEVDRMQAPQEVAAGAQFASIPIDGTACRYRSAWPVLLRPWVLRDVRLETAAAQPARLVLAFQAAPKAKLADMRLDSVRLHLAGDPGTAFTLHLLLSAHVESVTVSDGSSRHNRRELLLAPDHVAAAGMDRSEGVLPYPPRSFAGYRLLQEYLGFKERFLFTDLKGLDRAAVELELTDTVEVAVTFNRRLETYPMVSRDNVRLHCVPIINLFAHPADPIRLRNDRVEYLAQPSKTGVADRRHLEIYSVDKVMALSAATGLEAYEVKPFYSFAHHSAPEASGTGYYQTHLVPNVRGGDPRQGTDLYTSFVLGGRDGLPEDQTISMELTCTNRYLPAELRAGDINAPTDSSPPGVRFRNLIKPTPTVCPPLGKALHWRLISHMSLNYVSLTDVKHFKELLRVYDFLTEQDVQQARAQQRMLEGVVLVGSRFAQRMVRGAPLRGSQVRVDLNEDHFAGEGDAYLFAAILDRFFGLYVTLNSYSQLTARFTRTGQVHTFPPRWGDRFTPAEARDA